jgi:hypothetical protein
MTEQEWKIKLFMEHFSIRCKYFCGDEEGCARARDEDGWCTCNCDGRIEDCDLPTEKQ